MAKICSDFANKTTHSIAIQQWSRDSYKIYIGAYWNTDILRYCYGHALLSAVKDLNSSCGRHGLIFLVLRPGYSGLTGPITLLLVSRSESVIIVLTIQIWFATWADIGWQCYMSNDITIWLHGYHTWYSRIQLVSLDIFSPEKWML